MIRFADMPGANVLWWLDIVATTLSFFGSLWMIFCCLRAPSPKSLSLKLIAVIGIADFLYSIANLMSNFQTPEQSLEPDELDLCAIEALLRQSSYTLSIFFSTCIAVASYYSVNLTKRFNKTLFFLIALLLGIAVCALYIFEVPSIFEDIIVISQGPFYCWLTYSTTSATPPPKSRSLILTMTFQGLPVVVGLVITLVAYALAIKKLKEIPIEFLEAYNINVYRVLWYPFILFLTFVPTVADTALRVYYPERPVWLNALHLLLTHSIGFNNALLYGIQTKLYKTNYEEYDNKKGDLEDSSSSYIKYPSSSRNSRSSTVRNILKQAYSD